MLRDSIKIKQSLLTHFSNGLHETIRRLLLDFAELIKERTSIIDMISQDNS